MTWLLPLLFAAALQDPRITLTDLQMRGQHQEALSFLEHQLHQLPKEGASLGLHYWRGRLQEDLGRPEDAAGSFATSLSATPLLESWSRYRLALVQEQLHHPEMAAGLAAGLLEAASRESVVEPAAQLLARAVAHGGDCQLLADVGLSRLPRSSRRKLELATAHCALRQNDLNKAAEIWEKVLEEKQDDEVALSAARAWVASPAETSSWQSELLLGRVLHQHREFSLSHRQLLPLITSPPREMSDKEKYEARYLWIRGFFLQGAYAEAASSYHDLGSDTVEAKLKARAFYQEGRSFELSQQPHKALQAYQRALAADPQGSSAPSSILAALRLLWRAGREAEALEAFRELTRRRDARRVTARAALFLAASDLSQGRSDRAGNWLLRSFLFPQESAYWTGRAAALKLDPQGAVESFSRLLMEAPHHPLSHSAAGLLAHEPLRSVARDLGRRRARSPRLEHLRSSLALLRITSPDEAQAVAQKVLEALSLDPGMAPLPPPAWPLWTRELTRADEMLLSLGQWHDGRGAFTRHFPVSDPDLALTASHLLSLAGSHRRGLYLAEMMRDQIREPLPPEVLPSALARALFPLPYGDLLATEARTAKIDPLLLAALIREESRFDPRALSAASARGLTQFTLPTARRVAKDAGLPDPSAEDLYQPEVAIALGAYHLGELKDSLPADHARVAAYNAGVDQARLWLDYCFTDDTAEYFSKIGFTQTRNYVARVLSSLRAYQALYQGISMAP